MSLMTGVLGYFGLWTAFLRASHPTRVASAVAPNGDPWYTVLSADKIATLQLR